MCETEGRAIMRCVFVLFDSLNRLALGCYGGQVPTPNFDRLARRAVTFDTHYVGSMPCMPARRDLMTGRLSFLHRSWGPLEPFDNAVPEILHKAGVYSHFVTDHLHYWQDGGATYHNRYDSFEFIRGQGRDPWKAVVAPDWERLQRMHHPLQFNRERRQQFYHYIINRDFIVDDADFPAIACFDHGLDFIARNGDADGWFLQIETFSPHEPFFAPERLRAGFESGWRGPVLDWPPYDRVKETQEECAELTANYRAMVALCDEQLGRLLDVFDARDMWRDTALVVTTDHGFLLGEHDFWAKNRSHLYEELARIPLFVHHPGFTAAAGTRRRALTQTIDLAPTFLGMFGASPPPEMQGHSLLPLLARDEAVRAAALFGYFGGAVNVTDGRHTCYRYPPDLATQEIWQYTLMPTHLNARFTPEELAGATLAPPMPFTKGVPLLKVPVIERSPMYRMYGPGRLLENQTVLFDLATDPHQLRPVRDASVELRLATQMRALMIENDAPPEALARVGLGAASVAGGQ
jgi:arylsulfatase A-like enzyme